MKLFAAIAYKPFGFLWLGQTLSRLGDSIYLIAMVWWISEETGSAAAAGKLFIASSIPQLLCVLIGGVMVDRMSRLRLMFLSDVLSGGVLFVLLMLAAADQLALWHVYIAAAIFGVVSAFFEPAYGAVIPELVSGDLLPSANSMTNLSRQIIGIGGPTIGALVYVSMGITGVLAVNTASFLLSALCLLVLPPLPPPAAPSAQQNIVADIKAGFSLIRNSAWLWVGITVFAFFNVTQYGVRAVALPFLVKDTFEADVELLGIISGVFSLGAVIAALILGQGNLLKRRGMTMYGIMALGGLMTCLTGAFYNLPLTLIASFVTGISLTVSGLIWTHTLQELVPVHQMGRVFSVDMLGSYVLLPIGYAVVGRATDWLGAPMILVLGGALSIVIAGASLANRDIRALD